MLVFKKRFTINLAFSDCFFKKNGLFFFPFGSPITVVTEPVGLPLLRLSFCGQDNSVIGVGSEEDTAGVLAELSFSGRRFVDVLSPISEASSTTRDDDTEE